MSKKATTISTLPKNLEPYRDNHRVYKLIINAKMGRYQDFSDIAYPMPKITLLHHLEKIIKQSTNKNEKHALSKICDRVLKGYYDD